MAEERIPLSDLLDFVSWEVRSAHHRAQERGLDPVMRFTECEIDCAIDVEKKAEGGVHVWVLNLSADAKRSEKNTIKVKHSSLPDSRYVAQIESDQSVSPPKRRGRKHDHGTNNKPEVEES